MNGIQWDEDQEAQPTYFHRVRTAGNILGLASLLIAVIVLAQSVLYFVGWCVWLMFWTYGLIKERQHRRSITRYSPMTGFLVQTRR